MGSFYAKVAFVKPGQGTREGRLGSLLLSLPPMPTPLSPQMTLTMMILQRRGWGPQLP